MVHLDLITDSNLDSPLVTLGQKGSSFQKPGAKKVHCFKNLGQKKRFSFRSLGPERFIVSKATGHTVSLQDANLVS